MNILPSWPSRADQRRVSAAALFVCLLAGGCESRVLWTFRDDPYLHEYAVSGEEACLARLRSVYTDDRQVALRVLAHESARARAQGDTARAERLLARIIEAFGEEANDEIRSCIIVHCLTICGRNSERAVKFLCRCIAEGTWCSQAALSLAVVVPERATRLIAPLTRHPLPAVRYEAALALTCTDDREAEPLVRAVIDEMRPPAWPRSIQGVSLKNARQTLDRRCRRIWPAAADGRFDPAPGPDLRQILPSRPSTP